MAAATYAEAGRCLSSGRDVATSAAAIADALRRIPSPPRPRPRHPPRRPGEGGRRREPAAARRRRARGGGQLRGGAATALPRRGGRGAVVAGRSAGAPRGGDSPGGHGGRRWRQGAAGVRRAGLPERRVEGLYAPELAVALQDGGGAAGSGVAARRQGWAEALGRGERCIFGFALPPDPKWVTVMGALLEAYFLPEMTVQDPYLGLGCIVGDCLTD